MIGVSGPISQKTKIVRHSGPEQFLTSLGLFPLQCLAICTHIHAYTPTCMSTCAFIYTHVSTRKRATSSKFSISNLLVVGTHTHTRTQHAHPYYKSTHSHVDKCSVSVKPNRGSNGDRGVSRSCSGICRSNLPLCVELANFIDWTDKCVRH